MTDVYAKEEDQVLAIAKKIGFGRVMQLVADRWAEIDPRGALTVGPCAGEVAHQSRQVRVDKALANQLAQSAQRNSRMLNRIERVMQFWDCPTAVRAALQPILTDEDPALQSGSVPSIYERKEP